MVPQHPLEASYLILGQERIADAGQQHEADQDRDHGPARHDVGRIEDGKGE